MNKLIKKPFSGQNVLQGGVVTRLRSVCNFNKLLVSICVFLFCLSCDKTNEASLTGTSWKLVGAVDSPTGNVKTKTGDMKVFKPQNCSDLRTEWGENWYGPSCDSHVERCYTLSFDTNNRITGYASAHDICIDYNIDYEKNKIHIHSIGGTKAGEWFDDGDLFRGILLIVQSFSFTNRELRLYFNDNKNYLLFKPFKPRRKS